MMGKNSEGEQVFSQNSSVEETEARRYMMFCLGSRTHCGKAEEEPE